MNYEEVWYPGSVEELLERYGHGDGLPTHAPILRGAARRRAAVLEAATGGQRGEAAVHRASELVAGAWKDVSRMLREAPDPTRRGLKEIQDTRGRPQQHSSWRAASATWERPRPGPCEQLLGDVARILVSMERDWVVGFREDRVLVKALYVIPMASLLSCAASLVAHEHELGRRLDHAEQTKLMRGRQWGSLAAYRELARGGRLDDAVASYDSLAGAVGAAAATVAAVAAAVWLLREAIYVLFLLRVGLSERLELLGRSLEGNGRQIGGDAGQRQERLGGALLALARRVAVDDARADGGARAELSRSDQALAAAPASDIL